MRKLFIFISTALLIVSLVARSGGSFDLATQISQALVTAQGGEITIESAGRGLGTTISMSFKPAAGA